MAKRDNPVPPATSGKAGTKYASSTDVAKLAGVSQATVSRALSEGGSVSEAVRHRVREAAESLGYRPSAIPRMMLTHRSALIAVVTGGLQHPFYMRLLELFTQEIQKIGSTVLLVSTENGEYMDEVIPKVLSYRVDGIVSALSILSPEVAAQCARAQVPVVLFNGRVRNDWVASICSDNVAGGRVVADLFLRRGGRRFAYIGGRRGNLATEDRLAGFAGRLAEEGATDLAVTYGDYDYETGFAVARDLLTRAQRPDAIFGANDLMAIAAIDAARTACGLRVPEDVMVAGFDDVPAASWAGLDLTSIRQDGEGMVREGLLALAAMQAGPRDPQGLLRIVPAPLIERGSTRRMAAQEAE